MTTPTNPEPDFYFTLTDESSNTVGLYLCDSRGIRSKTAVTRTPIQRSPLKTASGATQYSDLELPYSSTAQDDWAGGRASDDFDRDRARYYDAQALNTMHSGQLILGPLPTIATGYRDQEVDLYGDTTWVALSGGTSYLARSFAASASYTVQYAWLWVRRVGTPTGSLTLALCSNSSGDPGTTLQSATVTTTTISDYMGVLYRFALPSQAITSGTTYWIKTYQTSGTPDASNYWEVGCDTATAGTTKKSTAGSSWAAATYNLYIRVTDLGKDMVANFFDYKGALYFACNYDDNSAGKIYMNGYRGIANSNSGSLGRLIDTDQSFPSTMPASVVRITDGAGVTEVQPWRNATYFSATQLDVSPSWSITHEPDGEDATEFVVLGTDVFTLKQTGSYPFKDVAVTGEMVWLCSGEARSFYRPIYKYRAYPGDNSAGTFGWQEYFSQQDGIQASYLLSVPHPTLGYVLWLATNNDSNNMTTVTRVPAPRDHTEGLITSRVYHSATTDGFMKARFISPLGSDSFNRADSGSMGNTDGAGHTVAYPYTTGGSGEAWQDFQGTGKIVSNRAGIATLTTSKALVGLALSDADVGLTAKLYRSAGNVGLFARRADNDNYVYAVHTGTKVEFYKRVGGVETKLIDETVAYSDGAAMVLNTDGTRFWVYYAGTQVGSEQSIGDAGLQSGAGCGLYSSDTGNTFDDFWAFTYPVIVTNEGQNTAKIAVPMNFTTGVIASDAVNNEDWRRYTRLKLVIRSDIALTAAQLQLLIDDTALAASPFKTIDFPALEAGVTYGFKPYYQYEADIEFDLAADTEAETVYSVGLNLASDVASEFNLWVSFRWLEPDKDRISVGDSTELITGLERYGDPETLWVLKEGSLWEVTNDIPTAIPVRELSAVKASNNGRAHLVHDVYLYFSLLNSLERYFRQNMDDVGPNRDTGLPSARQGEIAHMVGYPGRYYACVDGGLNNYSAIFCNNGLGWHEVYRSPIAGQRIRRMHIQVIPGSKADRLWFSEGPDVAWLPLPSNSFNPYFDPSSRYVAEGHLITAWMYSGMRDIVKDWKSVKLFSENLTSLVKATLWYQTDSNTTWTKVTTDYTTSPVQEIALSSTGGVSAKRIRFRLQLQTNDEDTTPRIVAMVVEHMTRIPVKQQYTFNFLVSDGLVQLGDIDYDDTSNRAETIISRLDGWMSNLNHLTMRSVYSPFDNKTVIIENLALTPIKVIPDDQTEQHIAQATVIEV